MDDPNSQNEKERLACIDYYSINARRETCIVRNNNAPKRKLDKCNQEFQLLSSCCLQQRKRNTSCTIPEFPFAENSCVCGFTPSGIDRLENLNKLSQHQIGCSEQMSLWNKPDFDVQRNGVEVKAYGIGDDDDDDDNSSCSLQNNYDDALNISQNNISPFNISSLEYDEAIKIQKEFDAKSRAKGF
jgi:hypothetical protein